MEFEGKVAFVTGAGSGIGKACAIRLAEQGARLAVLGYSRDKIEATADEIRDKGAEAIPISADIGEADAVSEAVEAIVDRYGRLDHVVANAGINGVWAPIDELAPHEFDKTIRTNLRGAYLTMHFCTPVMKRSGGGSVVVISSVNGTRNFGNSGATAYGATKAAQLAMTQMLALELASERIRVNAICPGRIDTEIGGNTEARNVEKAREPAEYPEGGVPLTDGEPGSSFDIAEAALFLLSDRARHITGSPLWIDGAGSLLRG